MKTLLALLITMMALNTYALECGETEVSKTVENTDLVVTTAMPKHLTGATIILKKADGTEEVLKAEDYMVVKRKHIRPVIIQSTTETKLACKTETKTVAHKNILSVKAIDGYSDVSKEVKGNSLTLRVERQVGAGLQYQRAVTDRIYVGGEVDSNNGVGAMIGLGF